MRPLPHNKFIRNKVTTMRLLDPSVASCSVCLEFLDQPVHLRCSSACGTKACAACWDELQRHPSIRGRGPSCRSAVDSADRDRVLADVLSQVARPCRNRGAGCQTPDKFHNKMLEHESQCPFRPELCPHPDCRRVMLAKDLADHVAQCELARCPGYRGSDEKGRICVGCPFRGSPAAIVKHESGCGLCVSDIEANLAQHMNGMAYFISRVLSEGDERDAMVEVALNLP